MRMFKLKILNHVSKKYLPCIRLPENLQDILKGCSSPVHTKFCISEYL